MRVCVCVSECVRVCVRACVRVCASVCVYNVWKGKDVNTYMCIIIMSYVHVNESVM